MFLVYIALQSPQYQISRELLIKAKPEQIFPYINHARKSNEWMPWADLDPKMIMSYSGPDEGVGSKSFWVSEGSMGTGEALVVESIANSAVKSELSYIKPMTMKQTAIVSLHPTGEGTIVRWSVTGENQFIGRLISVVINMDKLVGGEFEKGLGKLKSLVEI